MTPGVDDHRQHDPQQPAVERHAALPDLEDLQRVGREVAGLIEQDESEPGAEDHAERRPDQEIVDLTGRNQLWRTFGQPHAVAPADEQGDDVGQGVPADRQRPDLDGHRVEIGEHEGAHIAPVFNLVRLARGRQPL